MSSSRVNLCSHVQNVSKEMLQRRRSFTVFADEGRHLAEGCVDLGAMEMKAKLCTLKERWNELYDIARKTESTAEQGLKPLNEYHEIFEKFTARHEEVTLKLESEIPAFENLEQVNEQIEKDEVGVVREEFDDFVGTAVFVRNMCLYFSTCACVSVYLCICVCACACACACAYVCACVCAGVDVCACRCLPVFMCISE